MILEKTKVLLVEDNPADVFLLTDAFHKFGNGEFELAQAGTVESALSRIYREKFNAILLDLSLPLFFGLEPLIRIHQARPRIPVFVFSGYNDPELAAEAKKIGAQEYYCKNHWDGESLVQRLRRLPKPETILSRPLKKTGT